MSFTIKLRISAATLVLAGALAVPTIAAATPVSGDLFYTQILSSPNVQTVSFSFDGTAFTLGTSTAIGTTNGADGIAGNPRNPDLLIVGNGPAGGISTISKSTGAAVSAPSSDGIFHLEVANSTTVYGMSTSGYMVPPGTTTPVLVRYPINPDGSIGTGAPITLTGTDTEISQLITTPSGFFYTSSSPSGTGNFGTLAFSGTTATTTRMYGPGGSISTSTLAAAHGGVYDPFTDNIILMGDGHITQLSLSGAVVSDRDFIGFNGVTPTFDQGTVDGKGHLFAASNTGHLLFVDYTATGLAGSTSNFAALPFLANNLDDVAPLVGAGSTGTVPEPATLALLPLGLAGLGYRARQRG